MGCQLTSKGRTAGCLPAPGLSLPDGIAILGMSPTDFCHLCNCPQSFLNCPSKTFVGFHGTSCSHSSHAGYFSKYLYDIQSGLLWLLLVVVKSSARAMQAIF